MTGGALLVLDFDGVICDSVDECFDSSWTAWNELVQGRPAAPAPAGARDAFAALRPFVRSGEDFVRIHEARERGWAVIDQESFDAASRGAGAGSGELYRDLFYRARTASLQGDRARWLSMNRVYPHVRDALGRLLPGLPPLVLSTKKPAFIAEILRANGIALDPARILWSDAEPKLATVARLLEGSGRPRAVFVEDQVDAIRGAGAGRAHARIDAYLATWGYVKPEWLSRPEVPLLDPAGFLRLVDRIVAEA